MAATMLPSEKIELAIYKGINRGPGPLALNISVPMLSRVTGENDHAALVERLKALESEDRIRLSKYSGGQRWPRADSPDTTFFHTDSFYIEIAPQGRKYFEKLEQRDEQEEKPRRLASHSGHQKEDFLPSPLRRLPASTARLMPPKKVIKILIKLINDAAYLSGEPFGSPKREQWEETARGVLERGFAAGSSILESFRASRSIAFNANASDEELRRVANGTLTSMTAVLQSAVEQLGWEIEEEDLPQAAGKASTTGTALEVFVSHSSKDVALANALTDLLKSAFGIVSIRCSSVDGHRLPVGVNTESKLREEVKAAKVVVGLVTPSSLASSYVMFELGARWAASMFLAPLLAGVTVSGLSGPLSLLNAVSADNEAQLHQLLGDIGEQLGLRPQRPEFYVRHIAQVRQLALSTVSGPTASAEATSHEKPRWSNPKYEDDLAKLDGNEQHVEAVIGRKTIIIVVGSTVAAGLVDRPLADMLRDQVDREASSIGRASRFHRGVVLSDNEWLKHEEFLEDKPFIAVGGEGANRVAARLLAGRENRTEWAMGEHFWGVLVMTNEVPQIALYGATAKQTRSAVETYMKKQEGLKAFLKICWK